MKTLTSAETKLVSGGMENSGLAKHKSNPTPTTWERYLPSMRFDAARRAPGDTDDDTYNEFNDQGPSV